MIEFFIKVLEAILDWLYDKLPPSPPPPVDPPIPPVDPPPVPTLPGADYPQPLHADRTKGLRRIEFIDDWRTHTGAKDQKDRWKRNEAGALLIVQQGLKFPKGDAVWCWYQGIDTDPMSKGWEVCSVPGNIIGRRDAKVIWNVADGIETKLP